MNTAVVAGSLEKQAVASFPTLLFVSVFDQKDIPSTVG